MENLTPVTLVVKAPNQKVADQTIECALDWTVKKLKQHLSSVYPSKPVSNAATSYFMLYSFSQSANHMLAETHACKWFSFTWPIFPLLLEAVTEDYLRIKFQQVYLL